MNKIKEFIRRNPIFVGLLVILTIVRLTTATEPISKILYDKLMLIPAIIIGLSFHEAAHAYVSYWLGDPLPKAQGRLTLNPMAHIDIIGFLFLLIAGFGWGQPVQIDPRNYKRRRLYEFLVSIAGVFTNFIIAVIGALLIKLFLPLLASSTIGGVFFDLLISIVRINLILMLFNLIPCPPLDGWGIITQIFNLQKYEWWYKIYTKGTLILMLLIIFNVTDFIISPVYMFLLKTLFGWALL